MMMNLFYDLFSIGVEFPAEQRENIEFFILKELGWMVPSRKYNWAMQKGRESPSFIEDELGEFRDQHSILVGFLVKFLEPTTNK